MLYHETLQMAKSDDFLEPNQNFKTTKKVTFIYFCRRLYQLKYFFKLSTEIESAVELILEAMSKILKVRLLQVVEPSKTRINSV